MVMDRKAANRSANVGKNVAAAEETHVAAAVKVMPSTMIIVAMVQKLTRPIVEGVHDSRIWFLSRLTCAKTMTA
jgi:hypothetical protein